MERGLNRCVRKLAETLWMLKKQAKAELFRKIPVTFNNIFIKKGHLNVFLTSPSGKTFSALVCSVCVLVTHLIFLVWAYSTSQIKQVFNSLKNICKNSKNDKCNQVPFDFSIKLHSAAPTRFTKTRCLLLSKYLKFWSSFLFLK